MNVCIIESYVHAFISRIFISNDDDYDTSTVTRIFCIQRRWLKYFVFNDGDYDTVVSSEGDRYHMHIESCLDA